MKRLKAFRRFLCSAFLLTTLFSIAGAQQQSGTQDSLSHREVLLFAAPPPGEQYQLRPGDVLQLHFFQKPDLLSKAYIDWDGSIFLPFVDNVQAAGHTVDEVRSEIVLRYQKFAEEPQISVRLLEFRQAKVYAVNDDRGREVSVYTLGMHADEVDWDWQVKSLGRDEFHLSFFSKSFGGGEKFELTALLDGSESLSLGWGIKIHPTSVTAHNDPTIEVRLKVPLTALARLAKAREVTLKLGDKAFKLRESESEALRFIVSHFSAPAP